MQEYLPIILQYRQQHCVLKDKYEMEFNLTTL